MLRETTLFGKIDRVKTAIERIQSFVPEEGYHLADSGGKESSVCLRLLEMSGVKFDSHFRKLLEPPELVEFIRKFHPDTAIEYPKETIFQAIVRKQMPPTRLARYCCDHKEKGGEGRTVITGIRWAESTRRKNTRKMVEACFRFGKQSIINPIIDWSDADVWEFIRQENIPYCGLYDEGFKRLGCVGCPMAENRRIRDFERWPQFKKAFLWAFGKMIDARVARGKPFENWNTAEEVFAWWMRSEPAETGQGSLFEIEEE